MYCTFNFIVCMPSIYAGLVILIFAGSVGSLWLGPTGIIECYTIGGHSQSQSLIP